MASETKQGLDSAILHWLESIGRSWQDDPSKSDVDDEAITALAAGGMLEERWQISVWPESGPGKLHLAAEISGNSQGNYNELIERLLLAAPPSPWLNGKKTKYVLLAKLESRIAVRRIAGGDEALELVREGYGQQIVDYCRRTGTEANRRPIRLKVKVTFREFVDDQNSSNPIKTGKKKRGKRNTEKLGAVD